MTDSTRLEERTPNTRDCPDQRHSHRWRRRRPELALGEDRFLEYSADERGAVELTEEALSQLLRLAGFEPEPTHLVWWRSTDVDDQGNVHPVAVATLGVPQPSVDSWEWLGMDR